MSIAESIENVSISNESLIQEAQSRIGTIQFHLDQEDEQGLKDAWWDIYYARKALSDLENELDEILEEHGIDVWEFDAN